uniref:Reverse transcriptase Ty1/copia-type domain-containing protein n=1 Tax=Tanacetum cinerariifolium TaxID=118510 RepID=A0A699JI00_TANCI|nr:hypothetical protein [Tanacetum cinerariifolium]
MKETASVQQYVLLPLWFNGSKDPQNTDADAAFDVKEPESDVHVSPRVRDLSDAFEEFYDNSTNGVNVASTPVIDVGPNTTNNTNNFSAAGPFNTAVNLTFKIGGKSSFVDPSQYPDDSNMPTLEDIIYSNDEEDVAPQTRSMARMVKEQGFEDPDYPDKVYKVVKSLYGLHQALKACQEKYVAKILRKFGLTDGKSASTPIDTEKPLLKDRDGENVDVHTYSMKLLERTLHVANVSSAGYITTPQMVLN